MVCVPAAGETKENTWFHWASWIKIERGKQFWVKIFRAYFQ